MFRNIFFVLILMSFYNAAMSQQGHKEDNMNAKLAYVEGLFKYGDTAIAISFAQKQLDSLESIVEAGMKGTTYANFAIPYARLLYDKHSFEQVCAILKKVVAFNLPVRYTVPEMYVRSLHATKRYDDALAEMRKMIVQGTASVFVTDTLFKECYIARNGNDKGFVKMKEATVSQWKQAVKDSVKKELISREAPSFVLKDGAGNNVSLISLKGKTVVIDFWATWCGPCKASFPAMQQLKTRYRTDTNVVFLFIHSFEMSANPVPAAISYMEKNNYDFKVLFDLRDPVTKESAVAKSFGVKAIPAKYVIDPAGNIRFVSRGGVGLTTDANVIEHMAAMIELAAKSKS